MREAARRTAKQSPWPSRLLQRLYGLAVGYGYYPLLAAAWMVGVLVLASLVAWLCPQMFAPTDIQSAVPAAVLHSPGFTDLPTAATACSELEPGYPCFSPMQYAVGVALPVADLTRSAAWQPVGWAYYVMGGLRRLSWALTALLLAGVTGLLRKT